MLFFCTHSPKEGVGTRVETTTYDWMRDVAHGEYVDGCILIKERVMLMGG